MLNLVRSKSFLLFGSVVVLTVLAIALLRPGAGVAGQPPDTGPTDAYDFPIKPGTPEWAALKSHEEMLQVCQVPESILQEMSTEGLIETCLNYPLYWEWLAYSNLQQGFETVASRFSPVLDCLELGPGDLCGEEAEGVNADGFAIRPLIVAGGNGNHSSAGRSYCHFDQHQ